MMKFWIVPRADDPNSLAIVGASHRPSNAIAEAPKDQATGEVEKIEWLTIQDVMDEWGETVKVVSVNQATKDILQTRGQIIDEISGADSLLNEFRSKRQDLATQSRAFLRYIEGDSTMLNDMSKAIRFIEFCEYKRGVKMGEDTYYAVVSTGVDTFEIQEFPMGQRPSNLLAVAPAGFMPGDEVFLTKRVGGGFDIDWDARLAKFEALEKSADEARKTDEWNVKSPLERIKDAFLGGN